jgi:tyrosine-protein kinase Etk/Wzc
LPNEDSTVRNFRQVFRRHRLLILGMPVLTLLAAYAFIRLATPVYEGMTTIRLDKQRSNLAVLDALQDLQGGNEIRTEMAELNSRSRAEEVVDSLSLGAQVVAPRRVPRSVLFNEITTTRAAPTVEYELLRTAPNTFQLSGPGGQRTVHIGERVNLRGLHFMLAAAAANHERISLRVDTFPIAVRQVQSQIVVSQPEREASVVQIRYQGRDRVLAQTVPNELAVQFIRYRDDVRKTQARSTVDFLHDQITALGTQLNAAESGLLVFKQRQNVISPRIEGETQVSRLAEFQASRDVLNADRQALSTLVAEVERDPSPGAWRRVLGYPALLSNPAAPEMLRSLNELENQRAELRDQRGRMPADPEVAGLTQRIRDIETQIERLARTYLKGRTDNIVALDATLAQFAGDLASIPAKEMQLARLLRQSEVTGEIFKELQTRLKEAEIAAAVKDPSVRVIDPAVFPLKPIRPNKPLSVALALLLGVMMGVGLAFAREHLDDTIRSRDELAQLSGMIPVLGLVPRIHQMPVVGRSALRMFPFNGNGGRRDASLRSMAGRDPTGVVAEAYRTLRTNISFMQSDRPSKVIVVTSAMPGEGKSTSACNLAITLAQQGLRVALIDADMRRGTLHETLGAPREPGLSNVLVGRVAATDALQRVEVEGTHFGFMPAGTLPPNPAELLGSARAPALFEELGPEFDAIIIDTPPLNVVTDAAIIGSRADAVLMVARAGVTERDSYRHAVQQLDSVHARILGCILNDVDATGDGYYGRRDAAAYYRAASKAKP